MRSLFSLAAPFGLLVSVALTIQAGAQDAKPGLTTLKTERGRVYKKVEILHEDPHGITFRHSRGIAKIPFAELPKPVREKFDYDRDKALEFLRKHARVPDEESAAAMEARMARAAAIRFVPGAYTSYLGNLPITFRGPSIVDARRASLFQAAPWIYPAPANVPYDMYLWRQIRLHDHLRLAHVHAHRVLRGYDDVRSCYRDRRDFPRVAYESVPAIGVGRSVPPLASGRR